MAIRPAGSRQITVRLFFLLAALTLPSGLSAQAVPRFDVFGGFSAMRFDSPPIGFADYSYLEGWNFGADGNLTHSWGVAIDASGHYGSQLNVYQFLIGPQYSFRREKYRFFAHGFFGKAQNTVTLSEPIFNGNIQQATRNGFESVGRAWGGGGGFDWDFRPRISIRVFQADFLANQTFFATQYNVRVSTGVVFHFGQVGRRRTR